MRSIHAKKHRHFIIHAVLLIAMAAATASPVFARGENLAKIYKADLDYEEGIGGRNWTCTKDDVWSLTDFCFSFDKKLRIELGPSHVVFGKSSTSVVWAAVLPDKPGTIKTAPAGEGERVTSIFLRFNPALVGKLFPSKTVKGRGKAEKLILARRIYQYKINASWQHDNLPVIPWKHSMILDCETEKSQRRFFSIDEKKKSVEYVGAFVSRPVPPMPEGTLKRGEGSKIFEEVWKAFDKEYAMFKVKPDVDWKKLKKEYGALAKKAKSPYEAAAVLAVMLAHLEDLHVYVRVDDEYIWTYSRFRPLNASWNGVQHMIGTIEDAGNQISYGKTKQGYGYVVVWNLSGKVQADTFDEVLEELKETQGLVLDLRFNGGGDELVARDMAGRFLDEERIYSLNQYRNGPKHDQLGSMLKRAFEPRGPWQYEAPVAVLCGQKTMSSAESFALMMAQCPQAALVGDRTAGSSANPRRLELAHDITVNLPRWLDMDPEGNPIDGKGIPPDIKVEAAAKEFTREHDPVLEAGIAFLKKK